jgi:ubiquitin-like 1-activating enzyme E1 B
VAKNATKYSKILIDAGTAGFHGQSYTSIRFLTSCHNCYPSVTEENFAVCTIRNKPEKEIHCAVYAKNIVEQFFGAE